MKWLIPAKTFLLGEYAALEKRSAILITTTPYFELSLTQQEGTDGIHPESPAGRFWQAQQHKNFGLSWFDPYHSGGLGASSAQFIGAYLASSYLQKNTSSTQDILKGYQKMTYSNTGQQPSGYDLIAQTQAGCVYINGARNCIQSSPWPFQDLSFILLHTGIKLKTHEHLESMEQAPKTEHLSAIVDHAFHAFKKADSKQLLTCIEDYHQQLKQLNLVALHSLEIMTTLSRHSEIIAMKGCGALGADLLVLFTAHRDSATLKKKLLEEGRQLIATETDISQKPVK